MHKTFISVTLAKLKIIFYCSTTNINNFLFLLTLCNREPIPDPPDLAFKCCYLHLLSSLCVCSLALWLYYTALSVVSLTLVRSLSSPSGCQHLFDRQTLWTRTGFIELVPFALETYLNSYVVDLRWYIFIKEKNVILPAERSDRMARAVTRLAGFKSETLKILDCVIFLSTFDIFLLL